MVTMLTSKQKKVITRAVVVDYLEKFEDATCLTDIFDIARDLAEEGEVDSLEEETWEEEAEHVFDTVQDKLQKLVEMIVAGEIKGL